MPFLDEVSTTNESSSVLEKYTALLQDQLEEMKATYKVELHPDPEPFAVAHSRDVSHTAPSKTSPGTKQKGKLNVISGMRWW